MIKKDIVYYLDNGDKHSFRRLMYFARNNAWVNVAGDIYHISIPYMVQKIEQPVGNWIGFNYKNIEIPATDSDRYKYTLSKLTESMQVSNVSRINSVIHATKNIIGLSDLKLQSKGFDYTSVGIELPNDLSINFNIVITNFDSEFCDRINNASKEEKITLVKHHDADKEAAFLEAAKNEIWLAASSGDSELLSQLLDDNNTINIYDSYRGRNIIQAIFDFDPQKNLPFNDRDEPDWEGVIKLLATKAKLDFNAPLANMNNQTGYDLCQYQQNKINKLWFYERPNIHHQAILSAVKEVCNVKDFPGTANTNTNSSYWENCRII